MLRGYATCPILSRLGQLGFLDRMLRGRFSARDFPEVARPALFAPLLEYLAGLGLIVKETGEFQQADEMVYGTTPLGDVVFKRFGSACVMHSYQEYFEGLVDLVVGAGSGKPVVHRERNVLGSGQLHARKFFPHAYRMLAGKRFDRLIDVGCGNGTFLAGFHRQFPHASLVGVDISEVAISAMKDRLLPLAAVDGIRADGFEVESWVRVLRPAAGRTVVAAWYVIHEFCQGRVDRAVEFFTKLYRALPMAEVVVGEIVNLPAELLAASHDNSIMPEFLLFHTLSGQGVLTWQEHAEVLGAIPYHLENEKRFDEFPLIGDSSGSCPSSFIWHLRPCSPRNGA